MLWLQVRAPVRTFRSPAGEVNADARIQLPSAIWQL
jgi:hypothetical protein